MSVYNKLGLNSKMTDWAGLQKQHIIDKLVLVLSASSSLDCIIGTVNGRWLKNTNIMTPRCKGTARGEATDCGKDGLQLGRRAVTLAESNHWHSEQFFFYKKYTVTKKTHGHNFRVRGPKTNSVLKKWVSKDAIRFGTSHSKIVAVSFFRYGVLLVKKKLKRGPTSEGRNSAWNHHQLYVPYIFWKPRPCSFTWCYPIYVIHMQKN